ncbi:SRPBCC family protein [Halalkalibacter alkaliphilus]|uniref:SRPBCC family protein n=1 Tax=Halalkalibacter alkaliphilus TaxID=2917993 RepID=A0A9X2I2V5_9BACI|nr:SRPBCC family protein [Halalkalibacter alkaliphilus]MCL7747141.1 SRPBCC family protein [Halalkalibacter alkaliphilus]
MGLFAFTYKTVIDAPIEAVWTFFSTAENLAKITSFPRVTILSNPETVEGNTIKMKLHFAGLYVNWTSKVTYVQAPNCFIDKGVKLPFPITEWRHTHSFTENGSRTIMEDIVMFNAHLPTFVTRPILKAMFQGRELAIKHEFK